MLDAWLAWARRCQIPAFVELYHRINKHRAGIIAAVTHGLSNGLTESVNTKLRLLTRIAYGFRSTDNLIALCLLDRGGRRPRAIVGPVSGRLTGSDRAGQRSIEHARSSQGACEPTRKSFKIAGDALSSGGLVNVQG